MIKILPENLLFSNIEKKNILDKEKPNDKEGEIFLLFKKIQKNYENILTKLNKGCYLKEIKKEQDFIENQTNNDLYFISARAESYLEIIDSAIYSVEEQCMYGIKHESFEDEAGNVISGEHIAHNWDEYTLEEKNDIYRQMYRCPPQLTTQEMAWIEYHGTW